MSQKHHQSHGGGALQGAVVRGVMYASAGNFLQRGFDVLVSLLLLHSLSIYDYGIYALALSAAAFFTFVLLPALENVIISDVSGDVKENKRSAHLLYSSYIYVLSLGSLLLWCIFTLAGSYFGYWVDGQVSLLPIVAWTFLLSPAETALRIRMSIHLDFGWSLVHRTLRSALRLILLLTFMFASSVTIEAALWTSILASVLSLAIMYALYRKDRWLVFPALAMVPVFWKRLVRTHGKWAIGEDMFNTVAQNVQPLLIKTFIGVEAVALVTLATNLLSYAKTSFPVRDVLFPILPRADNDEQLARYTTKLMKYATVLYTGIAVGAAFFAPVVTHILVPKYASVLGMFYVLLLSLPVFGIRSVAVPVFYNLQMQKRLMTLTILRTLWMLIAALAIFPLFGVYGVMVWMVITAYLIAFSYLHELQRTLPGFKFLLLETFMFDGEDRNNMRKVLHSIIRKVSRLW